MAAPAEKKEDTNDEIDTSKITISYEELQSRLESSYQEIKSLNNDLNKENLKERVQTSLSNLKTEVLSMKHVEKGLNKKNNALQDNLTSYRKRFGELKWKEVRSTGYPQARRDDSVVDVFKNGKGDEVKVNDSYRWLEDPDSKESQKWINEQVDVTDGYLGLCSETVKNINSEMEKNLNFPRYGTPSKKGNIYYYTFNSGLQNQSPLYYHVDSLENERKLLIDPNTLSDDGTTSLHGYYFSENAQYICYGLSMSGSDWTEFHVKEVLSGKEMKDVLKWCKFTGITWTHDNKGFFYSRYDAPKQHVEAAAAADADGDGGQEKSKGTETDKLKNQKLYYHKLGTSQDDDVYLIDGLTVGDEEWMVGAGITYDGKYLELYITLSCDPVNRLYLVDISDSKAYADTKTFQNAMIKLIDNFDCGYDVINNDGTMFYFKTNNNAGNYRVIAYDISKFDSKNEKQKIEFVEIVAEDPKNRMESARCVNGNNLLLRYNVDVKSVVKLLDFKGNPIKNNIQFPAAGAVGFTGSKKHCEGFFVFTSFLYPSWVYHYDYSKHEMKVWKKVVVDGFNQSDYETKQVFYSSKDGTKIPMYILSPKDCKLDGTNPTILYGYGGFDISLNPGFRTSRVLWLKHTKGVYAIANLRGGGEYGEKWHKAGTKANKQNVFDDFHSAARYLISAKYTNSSKLAIEGGSNGGLLVAACCNQEPKLYRCGVANCGVLDMLRFHKFTIGYAWCSDYGCADKEEEFDALYKYSPLLNIPNCDDLKDDEYPCFMTTTADHDDRVSPLHSFKFSAELQHRLGNRKEQNNPLLIRIEVKSGHGSSSLMKGIRLRSDTMAFIAKCLDAEWQTFE